MFNKTKYTRWYNCIILNAVLRSDNRKDANKILGYSERHHIVPKCMGGKNNKENLAYLSAREHFICHLLLIRMIDDKNIKTKMQFALGKFTQSNKNQDRRFTSWEYGIIRKSTSLARSGRKHSNETCEKISAGHKGQIPWNKGIETGPISDEHKKILSDMYIGRTFEDRFGTRADDIKLKISNSKIGKPSGMLGKEHPGKGITGRWNMSEEGKLKISNARRGMKFTDEHLANLLIANKRNGKNRRGKHQQILVCPHCMKSGGASGIRRYHFDNCKLKVD